jgi:6-phosphogluconolactonase
MRSLPKGVSLVVFKSEESLLAGAATDIANTFDSARSVALTGGRTARALYEKLATEAPRRKDSWRQIHWFWGDDRFVSPDHPDSNVGMAQKTLLNSIEAQYVEAVSTATRDANTAAEEYASKLQAYYNSRNIDPNRPIFDLVLLSLGPDGHIASLLPGSAALMESGRWAAAVQGRDHPRITLTYAVLESARDVLLLASGAMKRRALARWFAGDAALPVARLKPACGIRLFADADALGTSFAVQ